MRKLLVRLACMVLALVLLGSTACAAVDWLAMERSARLTALELMRDTAFTRQAYRSNVPHEDGLFPLVRWEEPLCIYVGGQPGEEERAELERMMALISSRVPGLPEVTWTNRIVDSNIAFYFLNSDMTSVIIPTAKAGVMACGSTDFWDDCRMQRATTVVEMDTTTPSQRLFAINFQLMGALGFCGLQTRVDKSVLYGAISTESWGISEIDLLMLELLYSEEAHAGMRWPEFQQVMTEMITTQYAR